MEPLGLLEVRLSFAAALLMSSSLAPPNTLGLCRIAERIWD